MARTLVHKLVESHLVSGETTPGEPIELRVDQTLTQDATGTLVMLELEAMGLDRVRTELSVQYVDHNLVQADHRNPDDHIFLRSACRRFGLWYSPPGNGVSHPCHQERFGAPRQGLRGTAEPGPPGERAALPPACATDQPECFADARRVRVRSARARSLEGSCFCGAATSERCTLPRCGARAREYRLD